MTCKLDGNRLYVSQKALLSARRERGEPSERR